MGIIPNLPNTFLSWMLWYKDACVGIGVLTKNSLEYIMLWPKEEKFTLVTEELQFMQCIF